jgi:hypothetical protein
MKKITISLLVLFFAIRVVGQTLVIKSTSPFSYTCPGEGIVLYVQGGGTDFVWSPSSSLSSSTGDTVIAYPLCSNYLYCNRI